MNFTHGVYVGTDNSRADDGVQPVQRRWLSRWIVLECMVDVPSGDERLSTTKNPEGIGRWERSENGGQESSSGEHCEMLSKTLRGDC